MASGCVRLAAGRDGDPLVRFDGGMSWPFGTHTTQLYTVTLLEETGVTLLGELDKFVPLSAKRFSNATVTGAGAASQVRTTLTGAPGEVVHVTALRARGDGRRDAQAERAPAGER